MLKAGWPNSQNTDAAWAPSDRTSVQGIIEHPDDRTSMRRFKMEFRGFPGGPVVKNPPFKAEDVGSIPVQGTKIPYAVEQPNASVATAKACTLPSQRTTAESMCLIRRSFLPQLRPSTAK